MLKFEIRNIIVDKEIFGEDVLELVYNFGDDTVNMIEIEKEEMKEERRIEEMQMQIKMKELELEQSMLSKDKEERVPLVLPSSTKYI